MEKLIRDKIHITPHPEYRNMKIRKVQDILEHIHFLLLKIQEEQKEFDTASMDTKIEEAGDLLEVYDTLIDIYANIDNQPWREVVIHNRETLLSILELDGFNIDTILQAQIQKREKKWWFKEGIIWIQN